MSPAPPLEKKASLSAEERLLVLASRTRIPLETADRIQAILEYGPDWAGALAAVRTLRGAPLVHRTLSGNRFSGLVPGEVLETLGAQARNTALWNHRLLASLAQALDALNAQGLTPVVLKGASLAFRLYPDPGLRPMSDVDLLVREEELETARKALLGLGYFERPERNYKSPLHREVDMGFAKHAPELLRTGAPSLELHTSLFADLPQGEALTRKALARALPVDSAGRAALGLSHADELAYLVRHLYLHWTRTVMDRTLFWPVDIHEFLEGCGPEMDWEVFGGLVREAEFGEGAAKVLEFMDRIWDSPVPEKAWGALPRPRKHLDARDLFRGRTDYLGFALRVARSPDGDQRWLRLVRYAFRQFFPVSGYLAREYGALTPAALLRARVRHPLGVAARLIRKQY